MKDPLLVNNREHVMLRWSLKTIAAAKNFTFRDKINQRQNLCKENHENELDHLIFKLFVPAQFSHLKLLIFFFLLNIFD